MAGLVKRAASSVLGYTTYRQEPVRDVAVFPQLNGRLPEDIYPQDAPAPVPRGAFWNIGRYPAWPVRVLYQSLAIPEWQGVMGWPFSNVGKTEPGSLVTFQPIGGQNPLATRANIAMPGQVKLGDLAAVQGAIPVDPSYMKLM